MKSIIFGLALAANTFTACSNANSNTSNTAAETKETVAQADTSKKAQAPTEANTAVQQTVEPFSVKEIVAAYLQLKNALAKDDAKGAAAAGNTIVALLAKVDMKSIPEAKMKSYMDIADDLKENAEHIGESADKIDHQREHFISLSKDIADLVKNFGNGGQTLYKDFCPMANNGKGAIWISEQKEIKNPYYGKAMPTCGVVKEEIK